MTRLSARLRSATLGLALLAVPPALADAIPPPAELDAFQSSLIGYWHEEGWAGYGRGHDSRQRVLAFANQTMAITTLAGITYSNDYHATSLTGSWTATRLNEKTVKVTLDQGGGRGTELTLEFDGPDSFIMTDAEQNVQSSRFVRIGAKVEAR